MSSKWRPISISMNLCFANCHSLVSKQQKLRVMSSNMMLSDSWWNLWQVENKQKFISKILCKTLKKNENQIWAESLPQTQNRLHICVQREKLKNLEPTEGLGIFVSNKLPFSQLCQPLSIVHFWFCLLSLELNIRKISYLYNFEIIWLCLDLIFGFCLLWSQYGVCCRKQMLNDMKF